MAIFGSSSSWNEESEMATQVILVGSSAEDGLGIGNLIRWNESEVKYYWDKEEEYWVVTENEGEGVVTRCLDLMRLEVSGPGSAEIAESSLEELKSPLTTLNAEALPEHLRKYIPR